MQRLRFVTAVFLSLILAFGAVVFFGSDRAAEARSGFSSSRSFSGSRSFSYGKSAPWSPSTQGTWNRRGGGLFGPEGAPSSGYSKPSLPKTPPAPGYSKPTLRTTPVPPAETPTGRKTESSGYGKPTLPGTPAPGSPVPGRPPAASSGYSKPGLTTTPRQTFTGGSKFDKQTIDAMKKKRAQESLQSYRAEQSKFKQAETPFDAAKYQSDPLYQKGKVYTGFDPGSHYRARDNFYRTQGFQPPAYAFAGSPSFGIFDSLFLFWMLNHITDRNVAATAYHHQNDPGFKKWREEVDTLAKDNAELKAKLAELDKQTKAMEGTPRDPAYLPKGIPPELALSGAALASKKPEKPVLRFAAGQSGGWYEKYAALFRKTAEGLDVQVIPTGGSLDNLKLLASGKADIAIVQSDVLAMIDKKLEGKDLVTEQADLYPEYVQLIANRNAGIKSIQDIDPKKNVVYVGPRGSGTSLSWEGLCEQDPRFREVPVRHNDYLTALGEVERDPKALMMFVGGLNSSFLKKAEEAAKKTGKFRLVAVQERHFKDKVDKHGNPIYSFVEIPSDVYPHLQKGWIFSGDVDTLAVHAVLVLRTDWAKQYGPSAVDALSLAILETKPEIQRQVNGAQMKSEIPGSGTRRVSALFTEGLSVALAPLRGTEPR